MAGIAYSLLLLPFSVTQLALVASNRNWWEVWAGSSRMRADGCLGVIAC
jgi:hypothetical protein